MHHPDSSHAQAQMMAGVVASNDDFERRQQHHPSSSSTSHDSTAAAPTTTTTASPVPLSAGLMETGTSPSPLAMLLNATARGVSSSNRGNPYPSSAGAVPMPISSSSRGGGGGGGFPILSTEDWRGAANKSSSSSSSNGTETPPLPGAVTPESLTLAYLQLLQRASPAAAAAAGSAATTDRVLAAALAAQRGGGAGLVSDDERSSQGRTGSAADTTSLLMRAAAAAAAVETRDAAVQQDAAAQVVAAPAGAEDGEGERGRLAGLSYLAFLGSEACKGLHETTSRLVRQYTRTRQLHSSSGGGAAMAGTGSPTRGSRRHKGRKGKGGASVPHVAAEGAAGTGQASTATTRHACADGGVSSGCEGVMGQRLAAVGIAMRPLRWALLLLLVAALCAVSGLQGSKPVPVPVASVDLAASGAVKHQELQQVGDKGNESSAVSNEAAVSAGPALVEEEAALAVEPEAVAAQEEEEKEEREEPDSMSMVLDPPPVDSEQEEEAEMGDAGEVNMEEADDIRRGQCVVEGECVQQAEERDRFCLASEGKEEETEEEGKEVSYTAAAEAEEESIAPVPAMEEEEEQEASQQQQQQQQQPQQQQPQKGAGGEGAEAHDPVTEMLEFAPLSPEKAETAAVPILQTTSTTAVRPVLSPAAKDEPRRQQPPLCAPPAATAVAERGMVRTPTQVPATSPRRAGLTGAASVVGWGAGPVELERLYERGFMEEDISLMEVTMVVGLEFLHHAIVANRERLLQLRGGWCVPGVVVMGGAAGSDCKPNPVVRLAMSLWVRVAKMATGASHLVIGIAVEAGEQIQQRLAAPPSLGGKEQPGRRRAGKEGKQKKIKQPPGKSKGKGVGGKGKRGKQRQQQP